MNVNVAPIGPSTPAYFDDAVTARAPRAVEAARDRVSVASIPDEPPREVLDMIGVAARVLQELRMRGRELRFEHDPDTGRLRIEVRDLEGNVLRTIPPSRVLDVATGGGLD